MPTNVKYRPRITFEVTQEQFNELHKYLDYGMQRRVFNILVDDIIRMFHLYDQHFLIALLQKEVSYELIMKEYEKRNN